MWRLVSQPEKINGTHTRLLAIVSHTGSIFSHNSRLAAWPQSASRIKFNITPASRPAMCTPPSNARFLRPTQVCPQWHLHQFNHFCKAHQCAQDLRDRPWRDGTTSAAAATAMWHKTGEQNVPDGSSRLESVPVPRCWPAWLTDGIKYQCSVAITQTASTAFTHDRYRLHIISSSSSSNGRLVSINTDSIVSWLSAG